jgi:hypothetical protein
MHRLWIRDMAFRAAHSGFSHLVGSSTRPIEHKQYSDKGLVNLSHIRDYKQRYEFFYK